MTNSHLIQLLALLGSVSLVAACSSSSSAAPTADADAGIDAASDAVFTDARESGTDAVTINPTCVSACATVKTCYVLLDEHACQVQCSIELAGNGYLIPEIADEYFQFLADAGSDADCVLTQFGHWRVDQFNPDSYQLVVDDQATLQECYDATVKCLGASSNGALERCFMQFYRYNVAYREPIRACFPYKGSIEACIQQSDCICQNQFKDAPWVAMPCRQTDYCPYCP